MYGREQEHSSATKGREVGFNTLSFHNVTLEAVCGSDSRLCCLATVPD